MKPPFFIHKGTDASNRWFAPLYYDTCTQGFLTAITLQIDATIGWSDLGFLSFWPLISSNTLHIVIKPWTDILDVTLEVPEEIIGGAAVVKFQNKV